jgi:hypothetical protein
MPRAASLILPFLAACAAVPPAAPPPSPPPITTAPSAVASAAPAPPSAPAAPAVEEDPEPDALTEPLAAATRSFTKVAVPKASSIVSIHGRSARDLWMLTGDGDVIEHDGARAGRVHRKPCLPTQPTQMVWRHDLVLTQPNEVLVYGVGPGNRGDSAETRAIFRGGRWHCELGGRSTPWVDVVDGVSWSAWHSYGGNESIQITVLGGPPAPVPHALGETLGPYHASMWMRTPTDVWMAGASALYRFLGVSWRVMPLPPRVQVVTLRAEEDGTAWVITAPAGDEPAYYEEAPAGDGLMRWDGKRFERLRVPLDFRASRVVGSGPRDVWFVGGGSVVHQWDGTSLRRADVGFRVTAAWGSPIAGTWLGGHQDGRARAAKLAPLGGVR